MADWQIILCGLAMGVAAVIHAALSIVLAIFQQRLRKRDIPVVDVNFIAFWPGEKLRLFRYMFALDVEGSDNPLFNRLCRLWQWSGMLGLILALGLIIATIFGLDAT